MTDLPHRPTITIIAGADPFGAPLKSSVLSHLATVPNVQVQDLGTSNYYSIAQQVAQKLTNHPKKQQQDDDKNIEENRSIGLLVCGTGVGVSIFANKYPGIYAATCLNADEAVNARSISDANVLCLSGMRTDEETAIEIVKTFLKTEFKSPCPASGCEAWPEDVQKFLEGSVEEMAQIGKDNGSIIETSVPCFICSLAKSRTEQEFTPVDIMPGGSMKILRETPTSAIVRFKAGSIEPAHHHTFGHDLVVTKGSKRVWNLTKGENYSLSVGDYLFTPAEDVHRVKYFEDTEFFIKWDGHWDLFLDEDISEANRAIDAETKNGIDGNNA